jgi:hypothetical protein
MPLNFKKTRSLHLNYSKFFFRENFNLVFLDAWVFQFPTFWFQTHLYICLIGYFESWESTNIFNCRAIAQAVSRWLPTAAVRGSKPDLGMWDLWWDKVVLGRFSPSSSVSPAVVVRSINYSTITLIYHPGKRYNRPMCGRSTGTCTNLGDLQRDLRGSHPTK